MQKTSKSILKNLTPLIISPAVLFCVLSPVICISQTSSLQEILKYRNILNTPGISDKEYADAVKKISSNYQGINQDSAIYYCNKAIQIAIDNKNYETLAECYVQQGTNYIWNGDFESGSSYLKKAESTALKYGYNNELASAWDITSYMYQLSNVWDEAWIYAKKILDLYEKNRDSTNINPADAYTDFAVIYAGMGDYHKAINYFDKATEGYSDTSDIYNRGSLFIEYGKMLTSIKSFQKAKYYLDSAYKIFTLFEEPIQIADVNEKYGQYFLDQNQFDSAAFFFQKAFDIYATNTLVVDKERMNLELAKVAFSKNDFVASRSLVTEAYNFFKPRKELNYRLETIELLHHLDEKENRTENSHKYMTEYLEVSNMMKARNSELRTRELMTEYDLEQKEKENEKLKSQNEMQRERLALLIVSGMIIFIISILLYILYQQKNTALAQVEKMQKVTQERNSELGRLVAVKDKLISMIAHDIRAPLASLQNTISLTHDNILDKDEFDHLTHILLGETNHLRGMLDNMLLWARQQIVDIQVNKTLFSLNDIFDNIIELYQNNITQKSIIIHNNIPPGKTIFSDQDIVHTVLRNIFSNAVKFTPSGKSIYINYKEEKNKIFISVKDEGSGIPKDVLDKIEQNEFVSTRGTANEKGTGIGIIFSKDLINKLGESFIINTSPGSGTTVTISITIEKA